MDLIKSYLSAEELFNVVPRDDRFDSEIRSLPTDWVVRVCSLLNWMLEHSGDLGFDLHEAVLRAFAPGSVRDDLLRKRVERG